MSHWRLEDRVALLRFLIRFSTAAAALAFRAQESRGLILKLNCSAGLSLT
jgi:hypothetical protein